MNLIKDPLELKKSNWLDLNVCNKYAKYILK
jgi:hypothetical protein